MKYTGAGTESENEGYRKDLAIARLHVLAKKGVKAAYEAAPGYADSFLEIVADLAEEGEVVMLDKYSVTFVDWDDRWITTTVVEDGAAATAPEDPTREGYTFIGWDTDFDNVTENITVKAKYEAQTYTIGFDCEHGYLKCVAVKGELGDYYYEQTKNIGFDSGALLHIKYGHTFFFTAVPDDGYEFDSWENYNPETGLTVTEDVTVIAHFKRIQYTVTYLDWNATKLYEEKVDEGSDAKGPDTNPTREGYDFIGWEPDLKNITADRTVIAQYEKAKVYYTVTYLDWNATKLYEEKVEEGRDAKGPDENPTREGYDFIGWQPDLKNITADRIVIAQYETKGATGLDDLQGAGDRSARKVLRDGVLYIEREGKTYTVQGAMVK